jgi:O-acetyl-ADP-ribose deacetylase (regulator of RNase III)
MKNAIKYVKGDLFKLLPRYTDGTQWVIPHVCNNKGAWGAGFVVPLAKYYPQAQKEYMLHAKRQSLYLGQVQMVPIMKEPFIEGYVVNMVAQTLGSDRPLYYSYLVQCMDHVGITFAASNTMQAHIHCPKFGSGLAGGNWDFIEELIIDCWIKRKLDVTVYYL